MNKILSFLKQSNRYKHLVGGFIVGLPALTPYAALYAAAIAASSLELKDKLAPAQLELSGAQMESAAPVRGSKTAEATAALASLGYSQQEIAAALGRRPKTVDNALQRIKKKLEAYLKSRT